MEDTNRTETESRDLSGPDNRFEITHYSTREILRRTWPLLRPHGRGMIVACLLVALAGVAVALMPLFPKYVIDHAIPRRDFKLAILTMALFVVIQFSRMGLWYIGQRIILWLREEVIFHLRSQGFEHLQRLCLRFHNRYSTGFLYDRVFGNSINLVWNFLGALLLSLATSISALLFSLGFCLYLSPGMTAAILAGTVGYIAAGQLLSPRIQKKNLLFVNAGNDITEYIVDRLRGTKTIQALSMEDRVKADFDSRVWPMQIRYFQAQLEITKLHFVTEGIDYLVTAFVVVGGAYSILFSRMEVGTLVAFLGYQASLLGIMQVLIGVYGQFAAARAGFDQLFTILDTQSTVADRPTAPMSPQSACRLEFENVTFAYQEKPVLRNVTLRIPPGQKVALIGRSGSGKTTLANLLLRFYDPNEGRVLMDGTDIRALPLRPYRSLFGVVMQDPFLFNDTLAGNLRCAKPGATDRELYAVLERACALDFVNGFPGKIYQPMGDMGGQLSGGQRQRIAIARCMLQEARVVILDEATSALDSESEQLVQQSCDALFEGKTVLLIAHRLSTIRRMDRILVMDQGQIVEDGDFATLIKQRGLFHKFYSIATSTSTHDIKIQDAGFA